LFPAGREGLLALGGKEKVPWFFHLCRQPGPAKLDLTLPATSTSGNVAVQAFPASPILTSRFRHVPSPPRSPPRAHSSPGTAPRCEAGGHWKEYATPPSTHTHTHTHTHPDRLGLSPPCRYASFLAATLRPSQLRSVACSPSFPNTKPIESTDQSALFFPAALSSCQLRRAASSPSLPKTKPKPAHPNKPNPKPNFGGCTFLMQAPHTECRRTTATSFSSLAL